jgi:C_GCAxxG_C_C family probable redox protein
VFQAGSALAGGVAGRGETCGALLGAIMAIDLSVGRKRLEDVKQLERSMERATRVYTLFKEKIGHTVCLEIHKIRYGKSYRLFIPEEKKAFHDMGGHGRKGCPEICGIAARIAADFILHTQKMGAKGEL